MASQSHCKWDRNISLWIKIHFNGFAKLLQWFYEAIANRGCQQGYFCFVLMRPRIFIWGFVRPSFVLSVCWLYVYFQTVEIEWNCWEFMIPDWKKTFKKTANPLQNTCKQSATKKLESILTKLSVIPAPSLPCKANHWNAKGPTDHRNRCSVTQRQSRHYKSLCPTVVWLVSNALLLGGFLAK